MYTVEPPNKGHIKSLSTKDTFRGNKNDFPMVLIHSSPLKSGQPLYRRQNGPPDVSVIECFSTALLYSSIGGVMPY